MISYETIIHQQMHDKDVNNYGHLSAYGITDTRTKVMGIKKKEIN